MEADSVEWGGESGGAPRSLPPFDCAAYSMLFFKVLPCLKSKLSESLCREILGKSPIAGVTSEKTALRVSNTAQMGSFNTYNQSGSVCPGLVVCKLENNPPPHATARQPPPPPCRVTEYNHDWTACPGEFLWV